MTNNLPMLPLPMLPRLNPLFVVCAPCPRFARPKSSAVANRATGGGYEMQAGYPKAEVKFYSIQNIHAIRDSCAKLKALCESPSSSDVEVREGLRVRGGGGGEGREETGCLRCHCQAAVLLSVSRVVCVKLSNALTSYPARSLPNKSSCLPPSRVYCSSAARRSRPDGWGILGAF